MLNPPTHTNLPLYRVYRAFYIYSLLLLLLDLMTWQAGIGFVYGPDDPDCYRRTTGNQTTSTKIFFVINELTEALKVGIPTLVTSVSLAICIFKLLIRPSYLSHDKKTCASKTVTIFTTLFLTCNLPYFCNKILWALTHALYTLPGPIFSNLFMHWYSWTISKILLTVLNATLNPVLYFYRMPRFRAWLCGREAPAGRSNAGNMSNSRISNSKM